MAEQTPPDIAKEFRSLHRMVVLVLCITTATWTQVLIQSARPAGASVYDVQEVRREVQVLQGLVNRAAPIPATPPPTAQEVRDLRSEVRLLREELERARGALPVAPPPRPADPGKK
jgi:HAMP domain-containing protein